MIIKLNEDNLNDVSSLDNPEGLDFLEKELGISKKEGEVENSVINSGAPLAQERLLKSNYNGFKISITKNNAGSGTKDSEGLDKDNQVIYTKDIAGDTEFVQILVGGEKEVNQGQDKQDISYVYLTEKENEQPDILSGANESALADTTVVIDAIEPISQPSQHLQTITPYDDLITKTGKKKKKKFPIFTFFVFSLVLANIIFFIIYTQGYLALEYADKTKLSMASTAKLYQEITKKNGDEVAKVGNLKNDSDKCIFSNGFSKINLVTSEMLTSYPNTPYISKDIVYINQAFTRDLNNSLANYRELANIASLYNSLYGNKELMTNICINYATLAKNTVYVTKDKEVVAGIDRDIRKIKEAINPILDSILGVDSQTPGNTNFSKKISEILARIEIGPENFPDTTGFIAANKRDKSKAILVKNLNDLLDTLAGEDLLKDEINMAYSKYSSTSLIDELTQKYQSKLDNVNNKPILENLVKILPNLDYQL